MSKDNHHHAINFKTAFIVENLPESQVKISGELPFEEVESERIPATVALGKHVEIAGFRKGHIPQPVLEKHLGEMTILSEMAERAIAHAYHHIIDEHKIEAIGHPKIEITKLAKGNPLGFSAIVAVMPTVELPDYGKIAKKTNSERPTDEVIDEEIEKQVQDILRQKQAYERLQDKAAAKSEGETELPTPESETLKKENETPIELTDELVKSLGKPGQFENIADFKAKLREHLEIEKKQQNTTKHRATLTDAIIEETKTTLPAILIDSEIKQMFAQMEEDLEKADLKMEDYLVHIKKTKDDLIAEWKPAAEKRAKLQLILNEIARVEKLTPDMAKVTEETKQIMERFKDADEHRVRLYVASVMLNEDVMKKLETM